MLIAGKTVSDKGEMINVYECDFCELRGLDSEKMLAHEKLCYHKEEYGTGDL